MKFKSKRYTVDHPKDYLFVLKEDISSIHPGYKNDPLNLYLLVGSKKALLIDTGCRIEPIKPLVTKIVKERELVVINSHAHWDHVLGNCDFNQVYIHENEAAKISQPYNISFLSDSPSDLVEAYKEFNFRIPPASQIKGLHHGNSFNLGNISIEVIHTPGHSSGSICLLTNKNDLFTGDTAYYGEQFLPKKQNFHIILNNSLKKIEKLYENQKNVELYPSHGIYPCGKSLLTKLQNGIKNLDKLWDTKDFNWFFHAYELKDENFKYYIPIF